MPVEHGGIAVAATLPIAILVCLLVFRRWSVRALSGAFLSYVSRHSFAVFAWYRIVFGILLLFLLR